MSTIGEAKKKIIHFYCYTCKDYELKTSPHDDAEDAKSEVPRTLLTSGAGIGCAPRTLRYST